MQEVLSNFDTDSDNKVSFKEYIIVLTHDLMENSTRVSMKSDESDEVEDMAAISFVLCLRGIKKYFDTHDTNGDGTITVAELKAFNEAMGGKLTDEEAKGIIKSVDTDQNGQIDLKEFVTGMLNEFWLICLDDEGIDESEELFPKAEATA